MGLVEEGAEQNAGENWTSVDQQRGSAEQGCRYERVLPLLGIDHRCGESQNRNVKPPSSALSVSV